MAQGSKAARRPAVPRSPQSRRRRAAAIGVAAGWLILLALAGSVVTATLLLVLLAAVAALGVLGLRALGVTRDHPWVQQLAARPWRDGQDVLRLALRHLPELFVITPSGALIAPNAIELQLSPADLQALSQRMDLDLIASSTAEVYSEQVTAHGARFAGAGPVQVHVMASESVPPGRFRLRQGQPVPVMAAPAGPGWAAEPPAGPVRADRQLAYAGAQPERGARPWYEPAAAGPVPAGPVPAALAPAGLAPGAGQVLADDSARAGHRVPAADSAPAGDRAAAGEGPRHPGFSAHDGGTRAELALDPATDGMPTAIELHRRPAPAPLLRLVTGDAVAETRVSGARAGRGPVELALPQVPTVSREHARFVYASGQWWITNLGRNGLSVNGVPLDGDRPLSTGDVIRWGSRAAALQSWVEIS
ncbi:MAG TPA: FhaA domain-containing protein [Streptosporangiaceae bacterium]|jgi:hypothetical protein